jgi:siroheme synthase-like protein
MKNRQRRTASYYPLFIDLRMKKCVVIGGGQVALRKALSLLECRARVTVVSSEFVPEFKRLKKRKNLRLAEHHFVPEDIRGAALVVAATDSRKTNQAVAAEARRHGALVNVVDEPGESDFILPSFFRRGDLTVAVSTGGASPAFAKKIRAWLEESIGEDYPELLSLVKEVRSELKRRKRTYSPETWQKGLDLDLLVGLIRAGEKGRAKKALLKKLKENEES